MFWIVLQTVVLHRLHLDWVTSLIDAAISNTLLCLAGYVVINTFRFYTLGPQNYLYRLAYIIVLSIVSVMALHWGLLQLFSEDQVYVALINNSLPMRFVFALLMISFMAVVSWLQFYINEQDQNKARRDEAEKLLREAELARLRQQLQPHFLFNSLNSISALAGSKPEEARKMIQQLSDFLRGTLKKDEQQLVHFSDELHQLELYFEIEKVRFGNRLKTIIKCADATLKLQLPSLLLQPLVENAIKFGIYDTTGEITISMDAVVFEKQLKITIINPYDSSTSKPKQGTGFGLNAVQRRLYLVYGRNDLLTVNQTENTFITTLIIPQFND